MSKSDRPLYCPFTVLVDTAEGAPFEFKGIKSDSDKGYRVFRIETKRCCLGRYPNSFGDYSIEGYIGRVGVERKSVEDIQSTVLGWETDAEVAAGKAGRRQRFEEELRNLGQLDAGLVVIEGSLADVLKTMPRYGTKTREQNCKHFSRFLLRYVQDDEYKRTPWLWCDTRRMAEVHTFRFLYRFWKKEQQRIKKQGERRTDGRQGTSQEPSSR